jgi:hypothetical protein
MKSKGFIIALLLLFLFLQAGNAWAQNATPPAEKPTSKFVKDCEDVNIYFPTANNPGVKIDLDKPYKGQFGLNFRIEFEMARNSYHTFVECVFERLAEDMLGSSGANTEGIFGANAPNLPEWRDPQSSCINEESLGEKLRSGSPEVVFQPIMNVYSSYIDYIMALYAMVSEKVEIEKGGSAKFEDILRRNEMLGGLVEGEIEDSKTALETAFIGLKEMRKAFVMHVHFQCMLKHLEFYRRAMENLRRVISSLPSIIENASMH